ncbi:hypothetical protein ACFWGZ_16190, partial [Lentzea sp. NPDC060358]
MSNLERRYRTLLKVLPGWYRRDREEEMVGIFLAGREDDLDLEHGWPGWGETWAVLGLAVRTRFAAGAAPGASGAAWHGEVARALGVIGLLAGVLQAGVSIQSAAVTSGLPGPGAGALYAVLPVAAFAALLAGKRTAAKLLALVSIGPGVLFGTFVGTWLVFQLPAIVTFACLCLGFHREAPTPPPGRLAWWGGGALLLGVLAGPLLGTVALIAAVAVVRVFALVRGDFVLGRALSVFAVLELGPVVLLLLSGTVVAPPPGMPRPRRPSAQLDGALGQPAPE